jgi:hypothetical protein
MSEPTADLWTSVSSERRRTQKASRGEVNGDNSILVARNKFWATRPTTRETKQRRAGAGSLSGKQERAPVLAGREFFFGTRRQKSDNTPAGKPIEGEEALAQEKPKRETLSGKRKTPSELTLPRHAQENNGRQKFREEIEDRSRKLEREKPSTSAAGNRHQKSKSTVWTESPSASRKIDTGSTLSGKRNSGSEIADFNTSAQESSGTNRPAGLRTESGRQGTGKDNLSTQIEKPQHAGRTESGEKLRAAKRIRVEI